ncbi:2-amino-4-hydroxy-6-hydroxymethyldihydropteridinepyrophosphokinase [Candidatus Erwinia haradaeae]|uniref:2-amino-4-hydroxy-6-hydroxymethyldihydropteridine pyrophosphokinase n=1 Tax=Candidatus Erwinia haradaeae TaxID=1922217 RepID=A0A451D255_9GAMM|nr:2-amino-4-hydroxy-6-hydroxymethyldihydropteridine diphosphokinase [Candidatus Erwinia haradaeae]VFP79693.1 2-amino-4-hydroxy-6-hydroxymethyldihydropteridinepyrophosphokinase [Candidatus Erwinia haradaeae]
MNRTYLALGSNLKNPLHQIFSALQNLSDIADSYITDISRLYYTPPYGPVYQPDFLNAVVAMDTHLHPEDFLNQTQSIEKKQGRLRQSYCWGPRTLDVDIMLWGNQTIKTSRLIVPHHDMHNRAFMLIPLLDIAPSLFLPNGKNIFEILNSLDKSVVNSIIASSFDLKKEFFLLNNY